MSGEVRFEEVTDEANEKGSTAGIVEEKEQDGIKEDSLESFRGQEVVSLKSGGSARNEDMSITKLMKHVDKSPEVIHAFTGLMAAAQFKGTDAPISCLETGEPKPDFLSQLERIPREVAIAAIVCFTILFISLANSPGFQWVLLALGTVAVWQISANWWSTGQVVQAKKDMLAGHNNHNLEMQKCSKEIAENMTQETSKLYQMGLDTVKEVVRVQADVQKLRTTARQEMHNLDIEKDLRLKTLDEQAKTERAMMQNEAEVKMSEMQAQTAKAIETLKKETEIEKQNIQQKIRDNELKTETAIKKLEAETSTAIAQIDKAKAIKTLEAEAALEKRRLEAQAKESADRERETTTRLNSELEAKKAAAQSEMNARLREAQERTRQTEIENTPKPKRDCIVA